MKRSGTLSGGGDGGGRISPEHPSPILHAPRHNISCKDNPSLRYIYIYIYIGREREKERERDPHATRISVAAYKF